MSAYTALKTKLGKKPKKTSSLAAAMGKMKMKGM